MDQSFPIRPTITHSWIAPPRIATFAGNDVPIRDENVGIKGVKTSYALPYGATSFVIRLMDPAQGRSFTFVNENMAARGQLLIAVSNQFLSADNPKWDIVDGAIQFRHKRVFTVSLVGVDANFVRLTFHVEALDENTTNVFPVDEPWRENPPALSVSALLPRILTADQGSRTAVLSP